MRKSLLDSLTVLEALSGQDPLLCQRGGETPATGEGRRSDGSSSCRLCGQPLLDLGSASMFCVTCKFFQKAPSRLRWETAGRRQRAFTALVGPLAKPRCGDAPRAAPLLSGPKFFPLLGGSDAADEGAEGELNPCLGQGCPPSQSSQARSRRAPAKGLRRKCDPDAMSASFSTMAGLSGQGKGSQLQDPEASGSPACALCHAPGPVRRWIVKGAWSRKVSSLLRASSALEPSHADKVKTAGQWGRNTVHLVCSDCRRWATDLGKISGPGSHQGVSAQAQRDRWADLQAILENDPKMQMLPKSAALLAWVEQHEPGLVEGTLEHWVAFRIASCLEEDLEDAWGIHCAAAQLRQMQTPQQQRSFGFLVANVTSHRREIQTWISERGPSAFGLQELHLVQDQCRVAQIDYERGKWCTQTLPAFNTGKGTSGGLMLGARNHLNMRAGPSFALEGKGFQFGIFRFRGHDVAIGTIYLESGAGLEGGVNPRILAELLVVIQSLACKWLLAGDWNMTWEELQESPFPRLAKAGVVHPDQATTTQGRILDYALCSRTLSSLLTVEVQWEVPFRPHAAVLYQFDVGLDTPILRGPNFDKACLEQARDLPRPADPAQITFLLEPVSAHPRDTSWGGLVRWLEATACADGEQGRAWKVEAAVKPLVAPSSPDYPWLGKHHGYWGRVLLWVSQAAKGQLDSRITPVVLRHLEQEEHDVELEGVDVPALRGRLADKIGSSAPVPQDMVQAVEAVHNRAAKQHRSRQSEAYQQWLEAATTGGMKGLYAALRKPEATTVRPYRDLPLEIRPHARRAAWMSLWQPAARGDSGLERALASLKQQAIDQARAVGPVSAQALSKVVKKLSAKAPGLDGLTSSMLKKASEAQLQELAVHLAEWERQGTMPGAVLTTAVAMLPKKSDRERPIGLTSFGYRLWARARWGIYAEWAAEYARSAPWDGARKGISSLDIALSRLVRGEVQHYQGHHGVTLLLDLREFYEHVSLSQLLRAAQAHSFPPLILHFCVALYMHSRYICTEDTLAAPVAPTRGIVAGCPFAPGLSKLVMHPVMEALSADSNLSHCDLYIDDSSFDMESKSVGDVVHQSLHIWRHVKQAFRGQSLPISIEKSAWVCSSRAVEKKLAAQLGPEDPKIQSCWRDLGVDSAGGKMRRVTIHRQRFAKAKARSKKLSQLTSAGLARGKAARAGVEAAAAYGHQAVGLASKRMAFLRQLTAVHNGRMRNGSSEIVLDLRCETKPDPSALLVEQHLRSYVSIVGRWPGELRPTLETAFHNIRNRVTAHKEPWRIASGPVAATLCYLKEMRWQASGLTEWTIAGANYDLADPAQLELVAKLVHQHWRAVRRARIASLEGSDALKEGIDWTVGRKLLRKLPRAQSSALQAVWQGALRCGNKAWCSLCDEPASQEHLLWSCKWWRDNHPIPPTVEDALTRAGENLRVRGLPRQQASDTLVRAVTLSGMWAEGQLISDPEIRYATDGSPGSAGDSRTWRLTWAAIAYKVHEGSVIVVARASGPVKGEQTVFRAEASALLFLARHTEGSIDVTMDAKGVKTRVERWSLGKTNLDLFIPIREHSDRLQLHWIRSHQSLEQHCKEFGSSQLWRWWANAAVDKLAGDRANLDRDLVQEEQHEARDKDTRAVQSFLAERVALLFSYDKDQGPQVLFEGEDAAEPKTAKPHRRCRRTVEKTPRKGTRSRLPTAEDGPNKRDLFRAAVANPPLGHSWIWTSERENGSRIKCTRCQLGAQQIHPRSKVERVLAQPCIGHCSQELFDRFWKSHPTHAMKYEGVYWRCSKCKCSQHTGADETAQRLREPCLGSKKKKPPAGGSVGGSSPPAPRALFFGPSSGPSHPRGCSDGAEVSTRPGPGADGLHAPTPTVSSPCEDGAKKDSRKFLGKARSSLPAKAPAPPEPKQSVLSFLRPSVKKEVSPGPKQTKLCFGAASPR